MYYPIRPLRSVVKESAKSGLRSVSTRDLRRGCRAEARVNKIRPLRISLYPRKEDTRALRNSAQRR